MLKNLEKKGRISYGEDKIIRLTEESKIFCKKIYTMHKYLTDVFIRLGIDVEKAENEDELSWENIIKQAYNSND